jgi:hypothetical protein
MRMSDMGQRGGLLANLSGAAMPCADLTKDRTDGAGATGARPSVQSMPCPNAMTGAAAAYATPDTSLYQELAIPMVGLALISFQL